MQACLLRFRPIMMTTLAALFGALPLAIESGTGAELRFPLGISIIGGLAAEPVADALHDAGDLPRARPDQPPDREGGTAAGRTAVTADRGSHRGDAVMASISEPFIRRPVGTTLLAIGLFLIGIVAYVFLPVSAVPNVDFPMIRVSASRPGADPSVMAATVAAPAGAAARRNRRASTRSRRRARSARPASSCSLPSAATSTAPRATCRPRSTPRWRICRPTCRRLPRFRKANPAAAPVFVLALTSKTLIDERDV